MAKVVKAVAVAALIVGAAILTGGITLAPSLGALTAGGIVIGGTVIGGAALTSTLILAGATIAQGLVGQFAGKPALSAGGTGLTSRVSVDPSIKQWLVIGRTAMPTQLIYFGTSGATNENLSMVFVHACHPIAGFVALNLNNEATTFPTPGGPYAGILSIETADGTQTANPFTSVNGGEWGAAQIGRGLAMSHFRWTYDQAKLASGLPQNVQFVGDGAKVYDPRRDSTRGGSGSHRADNEATWAFAVGADEIGRNPALVELTYRLGWRKGGRLWAGMGEDPANLDFASYIASANICDEIVNSKPRYRIDGLLSLGDIHNVNLGKIHATCAGKPIDTGGLIGMWVGHDDTAVAAMTITDSEWVGDFGWQPLPEGEVRNTARGSFVDPDSFYQAQPYAQVQPSDLVALDNGEELADTLDFAMVQDQDQARRLASIRLRESRQGRLQGPLALKALGLRPSNVMAVEHPRMGWTARRFRVESMALAIDKVQIGARAVQSSDYADVANVTPFAPGSLPTVGFIPVLGVLAYKDFADWGTEVAGTGKPDDNATRNDDGGNLIQSPAQLDQFWTSPGVAVVERFSSGAVTNGIVDRVRMRFDFGGVAGWTEPNAAGLAPFAAKEGDRLFYFAKVSRTTGASGTIRLRINFHDAALTNFFSITVASYSGPDNVWALIGDAFICPAGTAFARPYVETDSGYYFAGDGFLGRSQPGADVTSLNTAADTAAVNGTPAATVVSTANTALADAAAAQTAADTAQTAADAALAYSLAAVPPKAITALGASAALDVVIPNGESRNFQAIVDFDLAIGIRTLTAPMEYRIGSGSWVGFGTADSAVDTGPSRLSIQNTGTISNASGAAQNYQVRAVVAVTGSTGGTVDGATSFIGPF